MAPDHENVSDWPEGDPWPSDMLPPPTLTLEISAVEVLTLIQDHEVMARLDRNEHAHETAIFHEATASFLKQQLALVAPHLLSPDRQGRA